MTPPQLEASFEELAATVPATTGIAIARPGITEVHSLGRWSGGVAWSTIKVPLAIAALRNDRARAHDLVVKAITESDNHASEQLWSQRAGRPIAPGWYKPSSTNAATRPPWSNRDDFALATPHLVKRNGRSIGRLVLPRGCHPSVTPPP